jgi:hypothetical protein
LLRRKGGPPGGDLKRLCRDDDRSFVTPHLAGRERAASRPRDGREEVRMAIPAGAVVLLDEKRRRRHDLLAQLREVDHWRRLVAARLDLAVAAVTSIDELDGDRCEAPSAGSLPPGLREILGLPACEAALPEASVLLRLRAAQRDLDEYARSLRESTDLATLELAALLDAERASQRPARRPRPSRSVTESHLRVVPAPSAEAGIRQPAFPSAESGPLTGDSPAPALP